jgi:hypothetical protein
MNPSLEFPQWRPDPGTIRSRRGRSGWVSATVVCIPLLVFVVLVALNLNGTSLAMLRDGQADPALIAGDPRAIRSDEWIVMTPLSIGGDRSGLPAERQVGLTKTAMAVAPIGGPSASWVTAFKAHDWGYVLFPADRGVAWRWWFPYLLCSLAALALLRVLGVAAWPASGLSAAITFSPYTAWWTSPTPALAAGWASLGAVGALLALRTPNIARLLAWSALSSYSLVSLFHMLYPPWVISAGLAVVFVVAGQALDLRTPISRLLAVGAAIGVPAVLVIGAWYVQNRTAIELTTSTIYPGARRSGAGDASLARFLSSPANPWMAGGVNRPGDATSIPDVASTWLSPGLALLACALAALLWARSPRVRSAMETTSALPRVPEWTLFAMLMGLALMVIWAFVPTASFLGAYTLLDRVQPGRTQLAMGLLTLLLVGVVGAARARITRPWPVVLGSCALVVSVLSAVYSYRNIPLQLSVPESVVMLSALVVALALLGILMSQFVRPAVILLVTYSVVSWGMVNPLYRGIGALTDEPLVSFLREQQDGDRNVRVAVFEDGTSVANTQLSALVTASGVDNLSGVTLYPNPELMERIAPGQAAAWNNYLRYRWVADGSAATAQVTQTAADFALLSIDPCGDEMAFLDVDFLVSDRPLTDSCLTLVQTVPWEGAQRPVWVYTRPAN